MLYRGNGGGHSIPSRWTTLKNDLDRRISHRVVLISLTCIIAGLANRISQHVVVAEFDPLPPMVPPVADGDAPNDCESCKMLVKSFNAGMLRTIRGKHEGGDTRWEEENLRSYADSEIRLVEIQEDLCNELTTGKAQCLKIAEDSEGDIEDWWFNHRNKNVRLQDYLCINKLKFCCPEQKFGPTCQPCPSDCNERGSCDGSGTRSGSGACICQPGYSGKECDECDSDYYKMRTGDGQTFDCLECHRACKGGCNGPTSANCTECRAGYSRDPLTNLCIDINECELLTDGMLAGAVSKRACPDGTYCVNTDGHYRCSECHRSCATCLDFGPDKCLSCAEDYEMEEESRICKHFSQLGATNPFGKDSQSFLKRYSRYALVGYYFFMLSTIVLSILWQVYNNWRAGQPYRELVAMRHAVFVISFSLTMLLHCLDFFSNAFMEER